MEDDFKNKTDGCPHLLDLIPKERGWMVRDPGGGGGGSGSRTSEERKLELRLAPPGGEEESSVLSLGYFSKPPKTTNPCAGAKRGFLDTVESKTEGIVYPMKKVSILMFFSPQNSVCLLF